jgi:hypothetical protein
MVRFQSADLVENGGKTKTRVFLGFLINRLLRDRCFRISRLLGTGI